MKMSGIITPMVTPFRQNGEIDYEATAKLLDYLKEIGIYGVFPNGSTGLFPFLSADERMKFLEFVIEHSHGMKVLAGIGSSSTQESVKLGKHAKDAGADALVLMPTYYITAGQEEILKHFREVIGTVRKETFIYSIPQLSGAKIEPETVKTLKQEFSEIIGLKESSADMRYFSDIMQFSGPDFAIFQGQDDLLIPSLSIGADGGVCGLTNFSKPVVTAYKEFTSGKLDAARKTQMQKINPFIRSLLTSRFPSAYYYAFYRKFGLNGGYRSPMVEPSESAKNLVNRALETLD